MNLSPRSASEVAPAAGAKVIGQYQLQMVSMFGKSTVEKVDITSPITVQDVLESAEATSKYRGMKITLSRVVKDKGQVLKFPVSYEVASRAVRPEQNYEVLPGDTITISADRSGSIDKMIESLTGGFN